MTMTGTHAMGGLALGLLFGWLWRTRFETYPEQLVGLAAVGFVFGQLLPDVDFFLTVPVYAFDPHLGEALHRSFTHSFVIYLPFAIAGAIVYARRSRRTGIVLLSVTAGMTMHTLQDVPFWFADTAIFWPVFHVLEGSPRWFGIWGGYTPPETIHSILFAWEYGSIAVYLGVLLFISGRLGTNGDYRHRLKQYVGLYAVLFVIALALVPFFDHGTFTEIIWAPSPIFWSLVVWITYKMRETIAASGTRGIAGIRTGT